MKLTKNQSHQNVTFVDGDDPFMMGYKTAVDATRQVQDEEMAPLSEFLSRPIKLLDIAWASAINQQINVWELFFSNKRVANRLTNYNLLRATLKVKFVVNGNAFYYGRAIASYMPFCSSDSMTNYTFDQDLVQLSQLPHVFLNPTTSEGGILTCPFFYNLDYAKIPTSQINELGYVYVKDLVDLNHANDVDFPPVTVSVFAWAEDVQMSVITSRDTETLIPQAGEIEVANSSGIVSGPATSIARIANALGRIPYISPYAKATELAASTVSKVASSFGYCRPSITKAPDFVRILPSSSFALTNTPDTSLKLSVDHKQESTVDPRISGIEEEDMLSIVNIAKRESYCDRFAWQTDDATGTTLYNCRVLPVRWLVGPQNSYHFTATAMAALPFRFWTGTLNYRFQIVCSGFHKGRLAVSWDPNFVADSPPELNTMYSEIIDIADTQDFTISISNGQPYTLIPNVAPGVQVPSEIASSTRYSSFEDWSNGVLHISVLNSLTTPNSAVPNDILVNVFISAGDDFKVFVPWDHFQAFVPTIAVPAALAALEESPEADDKLEEQAGDIVAVSNNDDNAPVKPDIHDIHNAESADHTNLVYTGESIPSFRAMIKRYSLWRALQVTTSSTYNFFAANYKYAIYPLQRGRYGNAPDVAVGGVNYAYVNTLLLHWVTYAFAGFRGNMRYKVLPRLNNWGTSGASMSVSRFSRELLNTEYASPYFYTMPAYLSANTMARSVIRTDITNHRTDWQHIGTQGMAWIETNNSSMLEFEVPFYSQYRFAGTRHLGWTQADTWGLGGFYLFIKGYFNNQSAFDVYAAAGEDFQAYFFIGLPRMYYEPTPPIVA